MLPKKFSMFVLRPYSFNNLYVLSLPFLFSDRLISSPQFSGRSYLALPTLTNAYSDLQLSMEFRPSADEEGDSDGVLLLTGESADMTGDYLALSIRDGRVELR